MAYFIGLAHLRQMCQPQASWCPLAIYICQVWESCRSWEPPMRRQVKLWRLPQLQCAPISIAPSKIDTFYILLFRLRPSMSCVSASADSWPRLSRAALPGESLAVGLPSLPSANLSHPRWVYRPSFNNIRHIDDNIVSNLSFPISKQNIFLTCVIWIIHVTCRWMWLL